MQQTLEKQEECDANVEDLVVGLAGMFPLLDEIENAVTLPQLKTTMAKMMGLVEDALIFIEGYKSDGGFGGYPHTFHVRELTCSVCSPGLARCRRLKGSGPSPGSAKKVRTSQSRVWSTCNCANLPNG